MLERAFASIINFQIDRPVMHANNDVQQLIRLTQNEALELSETPPPYQNLKEYLNQELADLLIFVVTLAHELNPDEPVDQLIARIVMEKIALNHARYPAGDFQEGDYNETIASCRERTHQLKTRQEFYE
jgi:NTP pyrophosphatase (non-canonical NTP hydrolase)